jgi:putative ABC transport system substrate-binding protein
MITRRIFLGASAIAMPWPLICFAQQQAVKIARIGYLDAASSDFASSRVEAFRAGLRDLGYVEGRNIVIDYRWANGKYERLPGLAKQLIEKEPDVIVGGGTPAIQSAQRATTAIPIVMAGTADPVGAGFVASLSRPGGNITGVSTINADLSRKYLELLRVALPRLSRVSVLINPDHPNHPDELSNIAAAAKATGVDVSPVKANSTHEIEVAFGAMARDRIPAVIVLPDAFFFVQARRIAELAAKNRLATMFWTRELVEAGGLIGYGHNNAEQFRRAATYVDKILKGAKPANLPVEQPTKLELVINLKTAKLLGLSIPNEMLLRADKIIE